MQNGRKTLRCSCAAQRSKNGGRLVQSRSKRTRFRAQQRRSQTQYRRAQKVPHEKTVQCDFCFSCRSGRKISIACLQKIPEKAVSALSAGVLFLSPYREFYASEKNNKIRPYRIGVPEYELRTAHRSRGDGKFSGGNKKIAYGRRDDRTARLRNF